LSINDEFDEAKVDAKAGALCFVAYGGFAIAAMLVQTLGSHPVPLLKFLPPGSGVSTGFLFFTFKDVEFNSGIIIAPSSLALAVICWYTLYRAARDRDVNFGWSLWARPLMVLGFFFGFLAGFFFLFEGDRKFRSAKWRLSTVRPPQRAEK
jgi:hypothetical protein